MRLTKWLAPLVLFCVYCNRPNPPPKPPPPPAGPDALTGFDNASNGLVHDSIHAADQDAFDDVESVADGLGPLYNAQSCRECHQNPTSGGASQVTELRVGHLGPDGRFRNPDIPIGRGTDTVPGRTLINDRAICPNAAFPDSEIQERVPDSESIRTFRASLNVLGDGYVEAVADTTLLGIARQQRQQTNGRIRGQALLVPIVEAPGRTAVGRFGWKDQHASLLSFAGDAYLNEMGITTRLFPDEVVATCNTATEPNDEPGPDGLADVDRFARFMRATKTPARDSLLAATPAATQGSQLFDSIGCVTCHVRTLVTAPEGSVINGGRDTVPAALGAKIFHPFGDFLLHDVGTGDGIAIAVPEHYGRTFARFTWQAFSMDSLLGSRNKVRTAPLWGVRLRPRLMHDAASLTFRDAIVRHRGEASDVTSRFLRLSKSQQAAIVEFLKSL
ncbi:MAG TPA: di-heme oxidoredictase family protein [Gemmatimonadales bacterium]